MQFGAQVRQAGGLLAGLRRGEEMGARIVQLFAQNNRQWRLPTLTDDECAAFRRAADHSCVVDATVCHAPYLVNVVSPDTVTVMRSLESLHANLRAATLLGAFGLVLHPGSHRGVEPDTATARIADALRRALDDVEGELGETCDALLENTAGSGHSVGRNFEELAAVIAAAGADERLGVCLDTQHLWASGIDFGSVEAADDVIRRLGQQVGPERLRCLHLNDSKVAFGAGSDRHENLGAGTIGSDALAALLGHPALQALPVVLEVPGIAGRGPQAADLAVARRLHAEGLAARHASSEPQTARRRPAAR